MSKDYWYYSWTHCCLSYSLLRRSLVWEFVASVVAADVVVVVVVVDEFAVVVVVVVAVVAIVDLK
jgi:hypothetical protein